MARKVQILLEDDLDGGPADETVTFSLDGVSYEIDLSAVNAARLRDDFAGYVGAARKAGRQPRTATSSSSGTARKRTRPSKSGRDIPAIRAWATSEGFAVNQRGRIPADVLAEYDAAHAG
jgi:hypothetical protein